MISSRFPRNSEANASELLENREEMFLLPSHTGVLPVEIRLASLRSESVF